MIPQIATAACIFGIAALFAANRDRSVRTSLALWLPVVWLLIGASRNVSEWMSVGSSVDAGERYLEGSPLDRNLLTLLIALGAITLARRGRRSLALLHKNPVLLLYFLLCGISLLWSDFPFVTLKRWFRSIGDLIMVLVVLTDPNSFAAIDRVFARVAFLLAPLSVLFIRYYPHLGRSYGNDGSLYWTGVAGGKNGLGMLCLVFGLASVWRLIMVYQSRKAVNRQLRLIAEAAVVSLTIWLLLIADSKTSLCCFLLAAGLMLVMSASSLFRQGVVLHLTVWTLIVGSFSVLFLGVGSSALETLGRDSSLTGRTDMWEAALRFADNPWVGAGYESFWVGRRLQLISQVTGGGNQAHNGYIEVYLNLGWAGVLLLAALVMQGYKRITADLKADPEVSVLRLAFFVMAIIYNFTEGAFKMMSPVWIAFLLAIVGTPWRTHSCVQRRRPSRRSTMPQYDKVSVA